MAVLIEGLCVVVNVNVNVNAIATKHAGVPRLSPPKFRMRRCAPMGLHVRRTVWTFIETLKRGRSSTWRAPAHPAIRTNVAERDTTIDSRNQEGRHE